MRVPFEFAEPERARLDEAARRIEKPAGLILAFLGERGADLGMRQSIIIDLARLCDLRWDGKDSYTLVGWGQCAKRRDRQR